MRCHKCGNGYMEQQVGDLPFKLDVHKVVVIKNVPCFVCGSCGEILIADDTMADIDKIIAATGKTNIELEVIGFAA